MKKLFLFLIFFLIGIVSALYAFPESAYNLSVQSCNKENSAGTSHSYSSACAGVYPGACGAAGDLLSCNDGFTENSTYGPSVFGGVNITSYNSSITNCVSVTQVFLCYEWWVDRVGSITNCSIQVDANGGASFSNVTTTCPAALANPGVTCTNVTSLETWSCTNFFGSMGTRALAREEVIKRGTSIRTLYTDVLFFNVTYTPNTAPYNISLNLPANNTLINNTQSSNFNFTAMDAESSIFNCSIYLDGILNQSNLTTLNRTLTNFLINGISYGSHNWKVNCSDGSLTNVSEVRYFVIADTIQPEINITYPLNITYNINVSAINYTITEIAPSRCWYSNSSGVWNSTDVAAGTNWTGVTSTEGGNSWTVYCNDSTGNINSTSITFTIDTISPQVQFVSPTETSGITLTTRNDLLVNATASDSGSGLKNMTVRLYNSTRALINSTNSTLVLAGQYFAPADCKFITNVNPYNSSYSNYGATGSWLSIDYDNNGTKEPFKWISTTICSSRCSYCGGSGSGATLLVSDFNPDGDDIYYLYVGGHERVSVCSADGKSAEYFYIDDTVGAITTCTFQLYINFTGLANGIYFFNATAYDNAGNLNSTETRNATIDYDMTVPVINLDYPKNMTYYINVSLLNYTYSDANPGYCWYSRDNGATNSSAVTAGINFTNVVSIEGDNSWTVYCNDTTGNINSSNVFFTVDATPPQWSDIWQNIAGIYSANLSYFNITWTDSGGIGIVLFESDFSGAPLNYTMHLISGNAYGFNATLPAGAFYWKSHANDSYGNLNSSPTQIFNVNLAAGGIRLFINGQESDMEIEYPLQANITAISLYGALTVYLNGNLFGNNGKNISLDEGYYNMTAFSLGDENHTFAEVTRFLNITRDRTSPEINIILPREGDTYGYNDSIDLSYSVFDEHLDSCWYNLDLGENISLGNNGNCQNISFGVSGNGRYAIYLYANDSLGNIAEKNINFSVNIGAPTIGLKSPVNAYLNYHDVVFIYTSLDIDLESCELWGNFDGTFKKNQTDVFPLNGSKNSFNLTLPDGNYTWNIKCNDSQGHTAFNGNRRFYIDTVNPGLSLSQPTGDKTSGTGIPLIFFVFDSSPVTCWYNISYDSGGGTFVAYPGKEYVPLPNCSSTIFNVTNDSTYIIYLTVNDSAGNSDSASSSFSVSTTSSPWQSLGGGSSCLYNWNCTEWSKCSQEGKQIRTCRNLGTCPNRHNAPKTKQNCTYLASERTLSPLEKALFDIALTIINPQIILGENLNAKISLVNYGNKTNLNVTLNYTITDSNNKTILREKEIVPVEIQNEFIKEFVLPSQITPGEYKLFVEINYEGQEKEAASQGSFEILSKKQGFFPSLIRKFILEILFLIIIAVVSILIKLNYLKKIKGKIKTMLI